MDDKELKDITTSALVLALAFGIALSGGMNVLSKPADLAYAFAVCLIGVSSGFIIHELGHRYLARRFNCHARYVMWPSGLMLALLCSLVGFVFAAPGAVMIQPGVDAWGRVTLNKKRYGMISLAGPVMNTCLSILFILLYSFYPGKVFSLGAQVNTWLALFNLIPVGPLDGRKIMFWDKRIWGVALAAILGLFVVEFFIF